MRGHDSPTCPRILTCFANTDFRQVASTVDALRIHSYNSADASVYFASHLVSQKFADRRARRLVLVVALTTVRDNAYQASDRPRRPSTRFLLLRLLSIIPFALASSENNNSSTTESSCTVRCAVYPPTLINFCTFLGALT